MTSIWNHAPAGSKRAWHLDYVELLLKLDAQSSSFALENNKEETLVNVLEQTTS